MQFDPDIAAIRFGMGLSPHLPAPSSIAGMLSALTGPDHAAQQVPVPPFEAHLAVVAGNHGRLKDLRTALASGDKTAEDDMRAIRRQYPKIAEASFKATLLRGLQSRDGFRERLTLFWSDHFATRAREGAIKAGVGSYVESAIRPFITGRFSDLLISAVTHPMMVDYLDQRTSIGPNSPFAQRRPERPVGLNENLAREILELHTLGVDAPYGQKDVRGLANLLTGLGFTLDKGATFRRARAEPGPHSVLGQTYRSAPADLSDIHDVLRDLAHQPATAAHLSRKLATHFVSDTPDADLIAHMETAYRTSDGDLMEVYAAMLSHQSAWAPEFRNVKPPLVFMISALRALDVPGTAIMELRQRALRRFLLHPLRAMGHTWELPPGPDGLPETDAHWISPPNLAARVQWALAIPEQLTALPNPRRFVDTALGHNAPDPVRFAARAAEAKRDGIGLVLMSPAFQRM